MMSSWEPKYIMCGMYNEFNQGCSKTDDTHNIIVCNYQHSLVTLSVLSEYY